MDLKQDMYDVELKPRMLRTLLREDVPDEKRQFDGPPRLSRVVSVVQTHKLLSESESLAVKSSDTKLVGRWKSAVDEWVNQLLSLVTSPNSPDKCWAGICLLGLTCTESSSERFFASYSLWFDKLLLHIQQSTVQSQFLKVAACASISDLITRLAGFSNAKKDGTSCSGKVIQSILKLLNEDTSEAVWEGAINLLCVVIAFYPAALHRHYDSAEAAITSKIFSGKCSANMLKKFAHCLALLPKSKGDGDSWLSMLRKALLLVNGYLTEIFQGLEEETKWDEAVRLLVPPGEIPPPSLWDQKLLEDTSDKERKRSKISSICTLMLSCSAMLTNPYPVQLSVPVRALLALVERVLTVNGSLPRARSQYVLVTEQEFICSELPVLHSYCLELLTSVIKSVRSQLLPHAAYTVRLVKEYFKRCELPELRIKVYLIIKILLKSMGVGISIYLAEELVSNLLLDLDPLADKKSSNSKDSSEVFLKSCNRKRKHGATGAVDQQHDGVGLQIEAPKNHLTTLISVKIAALEALEALLTVNGAFRSESWRSKVDHLIITVATDSCKEEWGYEEKSHLLANGSRSTYADFQLASLRALLASLLSPSRMRPPHLALGLELFHRGRREGGTELSDFCAHALLALEVLIHPRALPLTGFPSENSFDGTIRKFPETIFSAGKKFSTQFPSGMKQVGHSPADSGDDLYESWLGGSKDMEAPVQDSGENMDIEKPPETFGAARQGEKDSVAHSSGTKCPSTSEQGLVAASPDVEMISHENQVTVQSQQFQESGMLLPEEPASSKDTTVSVVAGDLEVNKMEFTGAASNHGTLHSTSKETTSMEAAMTDKGSDFKSSDGNTPRTSLSSQKGAGLHFKNEDDSSSTDSIPSIVNEDPDSDEEFNSD